MTILIRLRKSIKNIFSKKNLYKKDVFLTPGGIFGSQGDQFIRISLCNKPYNNLLDFKEEIMNHIS